MKLTIVNLSSFDSNLLYYLVNKIKMSKQLEEECHEQWEESSPFEGGASVIEMLMQAKLSMVADEIKSIEEVNFYIPIEFPHVQRYMEEDWFNKEAILINDSTGLEMYGSSAYMIPYNRI